VIISIFSFHQHIIACYLRVVSNMLPLVSSEPLLLAVLRISLLPPVICRKVASKMLECYGVYVEAQHHCNIPVPAVCNHEHKTVIKL
jgi:hypothetical protein